MPILLLISLFFVALRFFKANNAYERILSFYFIFTNLIILILLSSSLNFESLLDIVIMLFLLKLVAVLFLLFNRKKI